MSRDEIRERIRAAIVQHGARKVGRFLGLSPEAVLGLGLGSRVQEGTHLVAEANLHRLPTDAPAARAVARQR
jgi:hypothetical protein